MGLPFLCRWHEEDGYGPVENEIEVYDDPKSIQGKVGATVVAGGFDEHLSPLVYGARNRESGKVRRRKGEQVIRR